MIASPFRLRLFVMCPHANDSYVSIVDDILMGVWLLKNLENKAVLYVDPSGIISV